ncbi:MAG: hypothetical protein PVJ84_03065 [Desulfobacteraceae bacterium]
MISSSTADLAAPRTVETAPHRPESTGYDITAQSRRLHRRNAAVTAYRTG